MVSLREGRDVQRERAEGLGGGYDCVERIGVVEKVVGAGGEKEEDCLGLSGAGGVEGRGNRKAEEEEKGGGGGAGRGGGGGRARGGEGRGGKERGWRGTAVGR